MTDLQNLLETIKEKFEVEFEPLTVDDRTLEILAIRNMQQHLDNMLQRQAIKNPLRDLPLWAKVWPGSFVLGRLLRKYDPSGKTLLELGAGMGITSLIAASYDFASILLTDINEDALLFAKANVLRNQLEHLIEVRRLDVQAPTPDNASVKSFDLIVASELLYLQELHRPILKFLQHHLKASGTALFLADYARLRGQNHFPKLAARFFSCSEGHIGIKSANEEGKEERRVFTVYVLTHKSA